MTPANGLFCLFSTTSFFNSSAPGNTASFISLSIELAQQYSDQQAALYLREAANLLDAHVEAEQVKWLASHRWQVVHAQGLLLGKRQVSINPHLPLGLRAELVQSSDLLVSGSGGARLLWMGEGSEN